MAEMSYVTRCCRYCAHAGRVCRECPPRNTPCAEKPGSPKCLGPLCAKCSGFEQAPEEDDDDPEVLDDG